MGKILEYSNLGAPPADNDLLFMGDYSADASNPTTKRLTIGDLNKKRNVDAADSNGLMLRDNDGATFGLMLHDGGNIGIGPAADTTPGAFLAVRGESDANLNLVSILNPSATTNGRYAQMLFGVDAANDKSAALRFYYSTSDDASRLDITHYEDAGTANGIHLLGDGNVGIGDFTPEYKFKVAGGDIGVIDGSYGVVLDASLAAVKGITSAGADTHLHLNPDSGGRVYMLYYDNGTTDVNPALWAHDTTKHVMIGNVVAGDAGDARLQVFETANATNPVLKLQNKQSSGTVRTIQQFTHTVGATHQHQYLVWDGSELGINNDGDPLGAASINFAGSDTHGKVGINASVGTRVLEATETSSPGIVADFKSTAAGKGSKILFTNTTNSASVNQSQGLGFSSNLGGTQTVSWFGGVYRPSGGANNYFALNYVGAAASGGDSLYVIDTTLTNNEMYLDSTGNVTFRGNVAGDAFYDKAGTTVGNYCRGRFLQSFSLPYKILAGTHTYSPLFSAPIDTTDGGAAAAPITAKFASAAPHDGRIQSVRIAARNSSATDDCNVDMYIYAQAALPNEGTVTTNSLSSVTSSNFQLAKIDKTGTAKNTIITKGFSDFTEQSDTTTYSNGKLDFNQGDYLAFTIEADSGYAEATVTLTVEFYIDDTL